MLDEPRRDLAGPEDGPGLVVLHPHPDYGGDRHNPVVDHLWRAGSAAGFRAIRFDFADSDLDRGRADAIDALDLVAGTSGTAVLAGYSFGSVVAAGVTDPRVCGWALVAPPLGMIFPTSSLLAGADPRPKLVLSPAHDQYCQPAQARAEVRGWTDTEVEEVGGADHFLAGAAAAVAARVTEWAAARCRS